MSDTHRKLSLFSQVAVGVLLAVGLLAVALLIAGEHFRPLWLRFISESDPEAGRPPPEAFERFRREQEDIANAGDRGPIRCRLVPWPEDGEHPPDLRLELVNTSAEPVTLWYYTWPHAHVTFLVRDPHSKPVASFHWGTLSSTAVGIDDAGRPTTKLPTRTLKPGEKYTAGIWLSSLRDYLEVPSPGVYRVEAVFVYGDLGGWPALDQDFVARSQGVEIVVGAPDGQDKKPSWRLR